VPSLRLLSIIDTPKDDLAEVGNLIELRSLHVSCHWRQALDLSKLAQLQHAFISWDKGADSIFQCTTLEHLGFDGFKLGDYSALAKLTGLKALAIYNSDLTDLSVLRSMTRLKKLELINCRKLDTLERLQQLPSLQWLSIDGCRKISRIDTVSALKNLRILQFRDTKELESLQPIASLSGLEALSFFGDTRFVDGNLAVLETLPRLSAVGFTGRRHYSHRSVTKFLDWCHFGTPCQVVKRKGSSATRKR